MESRASRLAAAASARLPEMLVSLFAGVAGVAGSYAVAGFTPEFVAGPIAGWLARRMPASVVTFAIVVLGDLGHQLNLVGALVLAAGLLATVAFLALVAGDRAGEPFVVSTVLTLVGSAAVAYAVTLAPLASAGAGAGAAFAVAAGSLLPPRGVTGHSPMRRRALSGAGGALALVVGGYVLGSRVGEETEAGSGAELGDLGDVERTTDSLLAEADEKSLDVRGLEPLVSTAFYEIDINATNPRIAAEDWTVTVTGAVETEVEYTYEDIRSMPAQNQFVSLRCVGEVLNGKKMDNAVWTGVPIMDLVEPAGVPETCCVMLRAEDGFFEEFPLAALQDGFLAYGMNGRTLPYAHGYPARALIPGHWGEVNVKWLSEIEILETEAEGYWEQRGWQGTGPVDTVAKLHVDNRLDDGRLEVAGHAYAGTRGVERVEVSTDGGATWSDAQLSEPLDGEDVWRQWVHRYEAPDDVHEVVVRATDGTGTLQPEADAGPYPSGPTGWVSKQIRS